MDSVRKQLLEYLQTHNVMTLATVGPEGPWAAAVFYVSEQTSLYFLSAPTTRHSSNFEHDPRVAATIQEDYSHWKEIKGIQVEGRVARLHGPGKERAIELYTKKFSFISPLLRVPMALAAAMDKVAWYRLTPSKLYFIDNAQGFGNRQQIEPW